MQIHLAPRYTIIIIMDLKWCRWWFRGDYARFLSLSAQNEVWVFRWMMPWRHTCVIAGCAYRSLYSVSSPSKCYRIFYNPESTICGYQERSKMNIIAHLTPLSTKLVCAQQWRCNRTAPSRDISPHYLCETLCCALNQINCGQIHFWNKLCKYHFILFTFYP